MGAKTQAFDIFQTPLSSHYPLPLNVNVPFLYHNFDVHCPCFDGAAPADPLRAILFRQEVKYNLFYHFQM
jgi:hypothetical protein